MPRVSAGVKQVTRASLLEAAAEEFGRVGLERASVDAISLAAGFAKGTIYNYFSSKEDCSWRWSRRQRRRRRPPARRPPTRRPGSDWRQRSQASVPGPASVTPSPACSCASFALAIAGLADLALVQHWASDDGKPTLEEIPELVLTLLLGAGPPRPGES
jgi:AcrR family transcriptional regulator